MEQKTQKPSNRKFWGIATGFMVIPALVMCALILPPFTWGGEGTLSISSSMDRNVIGLNDSLNVTLTVKNTGDKTVRVAEDYGYFSLSIKDENGTGVGYWDNRPDYAPAMKVGYNTGGSSMKELKPGESITRTYAVHNYSGYDPKSNHKNLRYRDGYNIQAGHVYKVVGDYSCYNKAGFPTLPHWAGTLRTEEQSFTLTM